MRSRLTELLDQLHLHLVRLALRLTGHPWL
ncbi:hypothetical protein DFR74_112216 [Nocardia puris]|uniref:Uncharacterized protein n=1 Tax=Nocardia puris TaxID=208602 RepID=A0A366DC06_9NOCA|nr:hypothetical protein DFR74_112216 [Nocardia puris]